jgi:hypothetical protein
VVVVNGLIKWFVVVVNGLIKWFVVVVNGLIKWFVFVVNGLIKLKARASSRNPCFSPNIVNHRV